MRNTEDDSPFAALKFKLTFTRNDCICCSRTHLMSSSLTGLRHLVRARMTSSNSITLRTTIKILVIRREPLHRSQLCSSAPATYISSHTCERRLCHRSCAMALLLCVHTLHRGPPYPVAQYSCAWSVVFDAFLFGTQPVHACTPRHFRTTLDVDLLRQNPGLSGIFSMVVPSLWHCDPRISSQAVHA